MPNITDTITTADGACTVQLFTPEGPDTQAPHPGVIMYPDAGGVRDTFGQMAAKLAGFGYTVLLPDVYYRNPDWAPFDMATVFGNEQECKRLFAMIGSLTADKITSDGRAFFNYLADRPEVSGRSACAATAWAGASRCWWLAGSPTGSRPRRRFTAAAWCPTPRTARTCWPRR